MDCTALYFEGWFPLQNEVIANMTPKKSGFPLLYTSSVLPAPCSDSLLVLYAPFSCYNLCSWHMSKKSDKQIMHLIND